MCDYGVSPQQFDVICALSSGATITAAAEAAGIHRNTIVNWRRNSPPFQHAFAHAQYDRALFFREKTEGLVDLAFQTLQAILVDPGTPAAVRLKAALAIINTASTPPEPAKRVGIDIEKIVTHRTPPQAITEDQLGPAPEEPAQPAPSQNLHNSAQQPIHRDNPKVGRNEPCPCGSGRKYKRCCLDKPAAPALAHAA